MVWKMSVTFLIFIIFTPNFAHLFSMQGPFKCTCSLAYNFISFSTIPIWNLKIAKNCHATHADHALMISLLLQVKRECRPFLLATSPSLSSATWSGCCSCTAGGPTSGKPSPMTLTCWPSCMACMYDMLIADLHLWSAKLYPWPADLIHGMLTFICDLLTLSMALWPLSVTCWP